MKGIQNEVHVADCRLPCEFVFLIFLETLDYHVSVERNDRSTGAGTVLVEFRFFYSQGGERILGSEYLGVL